MPPRNAASVGWNASETAASAETPTVLGSVACSAWRTRLGDEHVGGRGLRLAAAEEPRPRVVEQREHDHERAAGEREQRARCRRARRCRAAASHTAPSTTRIGVT